MNKLVIFGIFLLFLLSSVHAQLGGNDVSIQNAYLKLSFTAANNKLYLKDLTNFTTGYTYTFNAENFLSVMVRKISTYISGTSNAETEYFLNDVCSSLSSSTVGTTLTFTYSNCSISGVGSLPNFVLKVDLLAGSKQSKWSVSTSTNFTDFALTQVGIKLPVMRDPSLTSYYVNPTLATGTLIQDPELRLQDVQVCNMNPGELCGNLPTHRICNSGEVPSCVVSGKLENKKNPGIQLFPFYRVDSSGNNKGGIYIGYDDPTSFYSKHFTANTNLNSGGGAVFAWTHYFYVPNDLLAVNSYDSSNDYHLLVGTFEGDWYDAAQIYKTWVQTTPITAKGKLPRADVPDSWETRQLEIIAVPEAAGYNFNNQSDIDKYVAGFVRAKNYYGLANGKMNLYFFSWYNTIGNYTPSIIPNLDQIIQKLKQNGINVGLYTFSQGVSSASSFYNTYNLDAAAMHTAANAKQLSNPAFWNDVYSVDPSQTSWQNAFSQEIAVKQIQQQMGAQDIYEDNPYGQKQGDYEPYYTGLHNHTSGRAGTYLYSGYAQQMLQTRNAMKANNPESAIFYEQGMEGYIPYADQFGTSGLGLNDGILVANNFKFFKNIPFSPSIYHEYSTIGPANVGPDYLKLGNYVANYSYLTAAGAIAGGQLNDQESVFDIGDDCMNFEMDNCYGSQGQVMQDHAAFLKGLMTDKLMTNAGKFLVYGQFLRPPVSTSPTQVIQLQDYAGRYYEVRDPMVLSSQWKGNDGSSGLYLINYNAVQKPITLSLKFSDLGLQGGKKYGLYKVLTSNYSNTIQASSDFSFTQTLPASTSAFFEFIGLPTYSSFNGSTTNFDLAPNIRAVANAVLEKTAFGKIAFSQSASFENLNLDSGITMASNRILIDSSKLPTLAIPAVLSLYNLSLTNPAVLKNNSPCPTSECTIISYTNGTLLFSVQTSGDYSAQNGSSSCIDSDQDGYFRYDSVACSLGNDCDDLDASIHPGATEICQDGIDQDCSGSDLSCAKNSPPTVPPAGGGNDNSSPPISVGGPSGGGGGIYCGNRFCDGEETPATCPADCPASGVSVCGDHYCNGDETSQSCPKDCGEAKVEPSCGDQLCSDLETISTCPQDCGICGDNICSGTESSSTCPKDCEKAIIPVKGVAPKTVNTIVFMLVAFSLLGMGIAAISIILHRRKII